MESNSRYDYEVNDIDDETKKLYSETIKDLIWLNNKK